MRLPARLAVVTAVLCAAAGGLVSAPGASAGAEGREPGQAPAPGSYDSSRLLVAFEPGTPAAERRNAHAGQNARVESTMDWLNLDVVRLPDGVDAATVAPRYERNPNVAYTDLNHVFRASLTPDDTLYRDEWGLHNTAQSVTGSLVRGTADADVDAPEGWAKAFPNGFESTGGTRVGVLDTGIDRSHVDLLGKTAACAQATTAIGLVVEGSCSDDNLHGTHVAGTIAANTGNGIGVAGVAPNAPLAVFKGLDAAGSGFYADIIAGIHWLHTKGGAKIISMSIGGPQDDALDKELTEAAAAGVLLIAAAGNDYDSTLNWPAAHRDVMSVGSINAAGVKSDFSNCNSDVEIAAPGEDIWSTFPGNAYGVISGTSMATPHVSGVAAMIMSERGLDAAQTRSALKSTAQGNGGCNGVGVVNLASALGASGGTTTPVGTGDLRGTVTDSATRAGLSGAVVDCGSGGRATTTSSGAYALTGIASSTYTCTASASGYRSKSATVTVPAGGTAVLDFELRKSR